jgi:hypothetical protein
MLLTSESCASAAPASHVAATAPNRHGKCMARGETGNGRDGIRAKRRREETKRGRRKGRRKTNKQHTARAMDKVLELLYFLFLLVFSSRDHPRGGGMVFRVICELRSFLLRKKRLSQTGQTCANDVHVQMRLLCFAIAIHLPITLP